MGDYDGEVSDEQLRAQILDEYGLHPLPEHQRLPPLKKQQPPSLRVQVDRNPTVIPRHAPRQAQVAQARAAPVPAAQAPVTRQVQKVAQAPAAQAPRQVHNAQAAPAAQPSARSKLPLTKKQARMPVSSLTTDLTAFIDRPNAPLSRKQ